MEKMWRKRLVTAALCVVSVKVWKTAKSVTSQVMQIPYILPPHPHSLGSAYFRYTL